MTCASKIWTITAAEMTFLRKIVRKTKFDREINKNIKKKAVKGQKSVSSFILLKKILKMRRRI